MATAVTLERAGMRVNGRWKRGSVPSDNNGSVSNGWVQRVKEAGVVLDWAPDLVEQVIGGTPALDAAYRTADQRRRQAVSEEARMDRLRSVAPDLAALVAEERLEIEVAEREVADRDAVRRVDGARAKYAPAETFADRASRGSLTWGEAAQLAARWEIEQREAISAERRRRSSILLAKLATALAYSL
jgi:hypothetical protein